MFFCSLVCKKLFVDLCKMVFFVMLLNNFPNLICLAFAVLCKKLFADLCKMVCFAMF